MIAHIVWYMRLVRFFWNLQPRNQVLMVGLGALSRVASMLSLLLPIKILTMAAGVKSTWITPATLGLSNNTELIAVLSVGMLCLFAAHIVFDLIVDRLEVRAARYFADTLFADDFNEGQFNLIRNAYFRTARGMTELIFLVIALVFAAVAFPILPVVLVIYVVVAQIGYSAFSARQMADDSETLPPRGEETPIVYFAHIALFLSFFVMTYSFVSGTGPGLVIGLFCFLMLRRASDGARNLITGMVALYRRKDVLTPLMRLLP